jgi:hypothetical protein
MSYSWVPAVVVAVLPKCPFCIMAYTGAMSLCSGTMLYPNADSWISYLILGVAALVLGGIALNHKGKKTWLALGLATLGVAALVVGQFYHISQTIYYLGVVLLFFGIWVNGSFFHFYHKALRAFHQLLTT